MGNDELEKKNALSVDSVETTKALAVVMVAHELCAIRTYTCIRKLFFARSFIFRALQEHNAL